MCGVQSATYASASSSDARLTSAKYVSVDGGSAAKNWATHVVQTNYINPITMNLQQETDWATEYATATAARKAEIVAAYTASNDLSVPYAAWKAWGVGLGVTKTAGYEGGWSPDYGGNATIDTLRKASKSSSNLVAITTTNYNNFLIAGGDFPSCFQMGGYDNVWSVFDPDIYATPSPQWDAIVTFNTVSSGLVGGTSRKKPKRKRGQTLRWLSDAEPEALVAQVAQVEPQPRPRPIAKEKSEAPSPRLADEIARVAAETASSDISDVIVIGEPAPLPAGQADTQEQSFKRIIGDVRGTVDALRSIMAGYVVAVGVVVAFYMNTADAIDD
jgi:hypothetical protein